MKTIHRISPFKNNRSTLSFLLAALFTALISHNTIGFDLYSHSIAHSSFENFSHLYKHYDVIGILFPRYLLLSDFYLITGSLGIPLGIMVATLYVIPLFEIFKKILTPSNAALRKFQTICIYTPVITITCIYYSALSLTIVWMLSYYLSEKRFLLLSFIFHPIALIMATIILLLKPSSRGYGTIIVALYFLSHIMLAITIPQNFSTVKIVDVAVLASNMSITTIESKLKEIIVLCLGVALIGISLRIRSSPLSTKSFLIVMTWAVLSIHILSIILTWSKITLFATLANTDDNSIMNCTWVSSWLCNEQYSYQRRILK